MGISERLKKQRKARGLTQLDIADALGVPVKTYQNWEQGRTEPDGDTLVRILKLLNTTADYLLGNEDFNKRDLGPYLQAASTPLGDITKLSQEDLDEINEIIEMKLRKTRKLDSDN